MKIKSRRTDPELRLSWTLYNLWERGDTEAIESYLKCEPFEPTEAMQRGRVLHEMAETMIEDKEIKELAEVDWDIERESRLTKQFKDGVVFTGIADVILNKKGKKIIIDWKTGKLNGYKKQLDMYAWVFGNVKEAYLVKLDDDLNFTEKVLVYPNVNWVEDGLLELETYLRENF